MKKTLWYAALFCSAVFALLCWRRYSPPEGMSCSYEIRENSQVWRLAPNESSRIKDALLFAVQPPSDFCHAWSAILPALEDEKEGIALFKASGALYAFLPRSDTSQVTSISASPGGRVLAIVRERAGIVEFVAVPELQSLGSISAIGPIIWKDSVSGSTFRPDRKTVSFTMAPR